MKYTTSIPVLLLAITSLLPSCKMGELASYEKQAAITNMLATVPVDHATRTKDNQTKALVTNVVYMADGPFVLNVPDCCSSGGFAPRDSMALYRVSRRWTSTESNEYWVFSSYDPEKHQISMYPTNLPSVQSGEMFSCMLDFAFCPKSQQAIPTQTHAQGGGNQP